MCIKAGIVFFENRPIVEYSLVQGNYSLIGAKIIRSMSPHALNAFSDFENFVFVIKNSKENFVFICLSTKEVHLQTQNEFLDEIEYKWFQNYTKKIENSYYWFSEFISLLINKYNKKIFPGYQPKQLDRQMKNIHITLLSNHELVIHEKLDIPKKTFNLLFLLKFKFLLNRRLNIFIFLFLLILIFFIFFIFNFKN